MIMDSSPLIKVGNSLLFKLKCQIWSELIHFSKGPVLRIYRLRYIGKS
ncbi:hypothetical protein XNC1_p0150 (plasmid) [Xenorhabdus nematophila ATCC 19061]|uniref:Uncharacterized protein n=1 Tax=Xenorhabdus nematophila (strain ATCC 19061 / DSM 3370 / CCUG 14189 / LMG 1036 / NCIMB 9965 / AN6) TaxID=406817 RepID=D3VM66_XENNA|nr:hypothetical protein XNC1_p0150 [Xenorhabdus nematophila ATCC 19061]